MAEDLEVVFILPRSWQVRIYILQRIYSAPRHIDFCAFRAGGRGGSCNFKFKVF